MSQEKDNLSTNPLINFYKKHIVITHLVLMGCVAVFLCFFALFFLDVWTNHGHTTMVPEIRSKSFAEATQILDENDLDYEIADSVYDSKTAPGTVKEIWPHPGTRVKPGRVIYLTINSFEPQRVTITMPLSGVSSRQAMTYLESLNIKNVRLVYVPSNFADLVLAARYKGKSIKPGMQIPVNAEVVLEVGTVTSSSKQQYDDSNVNSVASEDINENIDESTYTPIEDKNETEKPHEEPANNENPEIFN